MSETLKEKYTFSLKVKDLIENKNNKNNLVQNNINDIPKNQKVFGHNKRIKP
jgi:hypothetical protein